MARVEAINTCPIFGSPEGCKLMYDMHFGKFGDGTGLVMGNSADSNTRPALGIFPELPSTGDALSADNVLAGIHCRFLVNKAQTNQNTLLGAELQCRIKASCANGVRAGLWAYYEQSGTATMSAGLDTAICATVESAGATFSAVTLCGINVDSSVTAGATVTNFSAIRVTGSAKCFDYLIDVAAGGTPVVGVMRLTAISGVVVSSGGLTKTEAGYLIVYIGTDKRYIPLYSA